VRIIRRYLFRSIMGMTGLVLAVLLGLFVFIEFVGELNDVGTGDYSILHALLFAVLKLPNMANIMLPMAVLMGALLGLGGLANHSELVAIRAAGISVRRLAGAVMVTGIVMTLVSLVLGEYVGPPLDRYARQMRTSAKHSQTGVSTGQNVWVRDGDTILNISQFTDDFRFGGLYVFKMSSNGGIASIGHADSADVDDDNQWVLNNFTESIFVKDGVATRMSRRSLQANNLSADLVGLAIVRPSSLSGLNLFKYVRYLEQNGLDAQRYAVAFWSRIASAAAVAPMCVLALPFVFGRMRSSGTGARMVVGIIVGLVYFLGARSLADGGQVYGLNPALVAWLPTMALIGVTAIALQRVR
jgi:lipopolysaccharide export system permease protein